MKKLSPWFEDAMARTAEQAAAAQVMCAVEIMDTPFINSISKWKVPDTKN